MQNEFGYPITKLDGEPYRFTTQEITTAMQAVLEERGEDYVYQPSSLDGRCTYVGGRDIPPDRPGCIIGATFFHLLENDVHAIQVMTRLGHANGNAMQWLSNIFGRTAFPYKVLPALLIAQQVQDDEKTWGEALEAFLREISEI